jgi:sulfoxide reductase heme-binding subunit YedZ
MIRRLGGRRWQVLHRLVYVAGVTGVVHYYWLVKADVSRPLGYAAVVGVLLGFRLAWPRLKAMGKAGLATRNSDVGRQKYPVAARDTPKF